jgi:hypothetical protein
MFIVVDIICSGIASVSTFKVEMRLICDHFVQVRKQFAVLQVFGFDIQEATPSFQCWNESYSFKINQNNELTFMSCFK